MNYFITQLWEEDGSVDCWKYLIKTVCNGFEIITAVGRNCRENRVSVAKILENREACEEVCNSQNFEWQH